MSEEKECPRCHGTKKVAVKDCNCKMKECPCPTCGESGKVPVEAFERFRDSRREGVEGYVNKKGGA